MYESSACHSVPAYEGLVPKAPGLEHGVGRRGEVAPTVSRSFSKEQSDQVSLSLFLLTTCGCQPTPVVSTLQLPLREFLSVPFFLFVQPLLMLVPRPPMPFLFSLSEASPPSHPSSNGSCLQRLPTPSSGEGGSCLLLPAGETL